MTVNKLGIFLAPAHVNLEELSGSDLVVALAAKAIASRHFKSLSLELEWNEFKERVAKRAGNVWERLTPAERRRAAQELIAETRPSRRGGFETKLAELFDEVGDKSAGLWVEEEAPDPEPEREVSVEESLRLLDGYKEEMASRRLGLGPRARTEVLLRLLEVPATAVTKVCKLVTRSDGLQAAEAVLSDHAVAQQESQVEGEHETVRRLLGLVPARARALHDIYTQAGARKLLAALEQLQTKHGGEAKLAAALDQAMRNMWQFAVDHPKSIALQPLEWFTTALRRAVAHDNGFAVVFSCL